MGSTATGNQAARAGLLGGGGVPPQVVGLNPARQPGSREFALLSMPMRVTLSWWQSCCPCPQAILQDPTLLSSAFEPVNQGDLDREAHPTSL